MPPAGDSAANATPAEAWAESRRRLVDIKRYTNAVFEWLGTSAHDLGYPGHKLSHRSWEAPSNEAKHGGSRGWVVRVNDLFYLARYISEANPPVEMPEEIAIALSRAVRLRRTFGDWRMAAGLKNNPVLERSHDHTTNRLQDVEDMLKAKHVPQAAPASGISRTVGGDFSALNDGAADSVAES